MAKMVSDKEREELEASEPVRMDPYVYGASQLLQPDDPLRRQQQAVDHAQSERERLQLEKQNRERADRKAKAAKDLEDLDQKKAEARELMAQEERERIVSELRTQYFLANAWATAEDFERALPALLDERGRQQMAQREQAERQSVTYSHVGSRY